METIEKCQTLTLSFSMLPNCQYLISVLFFAFSSTANNLKSPTKSPPKVVPEHVGESIFQAMLSGPRLISTLLVAKPDVVRRHLRKLLKKVTLTGFRVVGCKLKTLSAEEAASIVPGPVQSVSNVETPILVVIIMARMLIRLEVTLFLAFTFSQCRLTSRPPA